MVSSSLSRVARLRATSLRGSVVSSSEYWEVLGGGKKSCWDVSCGGFGLVVGMFAHNLLVECKHSILTILLGSQAGVKGAVLGA